ALLAGRCGERRALTLASGFFAGLTLLAKTMTAAFLCVPFAWALWQARERRARRRLGAAFLLAAAVASLWWLPNGGAALHYLWRYGVGAEAAPFAAGGDSLLGWRNLSFYPLALVNEGVGPLLALLGLAVAVVSARRAERGDRLLLGWALTSLAILT